MTNRYALRMDEPESWTIFDIFTGQPVELKQQVMVAMNLRDAEAMADRLNSRDVKRRAKADRKS
ncbi:MULTISPECIES: hypothetical protein [unclassified Mesorhizobium]|jgi:hypothetical protein|uniref:hypothetical protein n=1 Tax=unclassified Mesorhizobium TaxID=325217 RepID=UPI0003CF6ED6|nr:MULTISPECIES: hypothetical protein [unclassified Mesorhizobium]ESW65204.1 hypothetical protein X771_22655 [Mesorhizobium sp. LSJC277A00]ESX56303.1 hypothetical protein X760_24135 [Mesorhizobium sp. LSHC422A00]ESX83803.1 hypothetical protein X756_28550 [Mesorhizobium sp. LSHC412B00]ESY12180.1 hypothetical protein X752_12530 [Mesorhizobium sp. LNJC398B00]ESY33023.1 hypothetical protein X748_22885 [Mesorhizobium sp. LNJC386A00]